MGRAVGRGGEGEEDGIEAVTSDTVGVAANFWRQPFQPRSPSEGAREGSFAQYLHQLGAKCRADVVTAHSTLARLVLM